MTASEYYQGIFNSEAAVTIAIDGLYDLKETAVSTSHVLITDKIYSAYHYDENFEHKKLLNPDRAKGCRQRHDFILINIDHDEVEFFLLEMKSAKDNFEHIRNQLQGGVALMSFLQRMGIDKGGSIDSFSDVRFYAASLFHTKQLPNSTNMEKLKDEVRKRVEERKRYATIPGIICVENNRISISELRQKAKRVLLDWHAVNDFVEFPK